MLIRSMSPEIIICDEIGSLDDILAIEEATCKRSERNIYSTRIRCRRNRIESKFKKNYSK